MYLAGVFSTILLWILAAAVAVQCLYVLFFFIKSFHLSSVQGGNYDRQAVSVIVCAKNESENLRKNLPEILAQRYSSETGKLLFEVIVVNDCSEDDTEQVLRELEQQYENLWHVSILPGDDRCFPGKKYALSRGLEHAAHELLLLTDADCVPASRFWLEHMVRPLHKGKKIVAGFGQYRKSSGSVNSFTRWETLHTFLQYSCYTLAGKPYMAVGRNLACTKASLLAAQATGVWKELPSGDDDLLVSTQANRTNMAIVSEPEAFTITDSKESWGAWLKQKQRHVSTGKYYSNDVKVLLGVYALSHTLCWIGFVVLLFSGRWAEALLVMGLRCIIYWFTWASLARKLNETDLIPLFPLFDIGWLIYNFVLSPYIFLKNKTQWK